MTMGDGLALLTPWLRPVVVLIVVVGLVEMIVPAGALSRYVDLFLGLLVLVALLNPLVALLGGNLWGQIEAVEPTLFPRPPLRGEELLPPSTLSTSSQDLAEELFQGQLEREVVRLLLTLPQVAAAEARVVLAPAVDGEPGPLAGKPPAVELVEITLWPSRADAPGTPRDQPVYELLARHFGWPAGLVVLRWQPD